MKIYISLLKTEPLNKYSIYNIYKILIKENLFYRIEYTNCYIILYIFLDLFKLYNIYLFNGLRSKMYKLYVFKL